MRDSTRADQICLNTPGMSDATPFSMVWSDGEFLDSRERGASGSDSKLRFPTQESMLYPKLGGVLGVALLRFLCDETQRSFSDQRSLGRRRGYTGKRSAHERAWPLLLAGGSRALRSRTRK